MLTEEQAKEFLSALDKITLISCGRKFSDIISMGISEEYTKNTLECMAASFRDSMNALADKYITEVKADVRRTFENKRDGGETKESENKDA